MYSLNRFIGPILLLLAFSLLFGFFLRSETVEPLPQVVESPRVEHVLKEEPTSSESAPLPTVDDDNEASGIAEPAKAVSNDPIESELVDESSSDDDPSESSPGSDQQEQIQELSARCKALMQDFRGAETDEEFGDIYRQKSAQERQQIDECVNQ